MEEKRKSGRPAGSRRSSTREEIVCRHSADCEKCPLPDCKPGKSKDYTRLNSHLFEIA